MARIFGWRIFSPQSVEYSCVFEKLFIFLQQISNKKLSMIK